MIEDAAERRALLLRMAAVQPPACLADLDDDVLRKIASRLAESELASAVALKRCSSRFKDLAAPLVANALLVTKEKWQDAAAKVGGRVGAKITGALERNEVPTSLDVRGNKIGPTGATAIADALKGTGVLTKLDLAHNNIRPEGTKAIGAALRGNAVLTELNLGSNELCGLDHYGSGTYSAAGITALAEALKVNGVLTHLDLGDNGIRHQGAAAIAEALRGNEVMKTLDLSGNRISDAGAKAIAEALRGNAVLTTLNLRGNGFGDEGAKALASALRVNAGVLKSINLCYNRLGKAGKGAIRDAVSGRVGFKLEM